MRLDLLRYACPGAINGILLVNEEPICYTIELPWRDNKPNKSCIPEGTYQVEKRYSERFKRHMIIKGVPGRSLILFHPANDAIKELRGCIAPVTSFSGYGRGVGSTKAFLQLRKVVYAAIDKKDEVWLTIHPKCRLSDEEVESFISNL